MREGKTMVRAKKVREAVYKRLKDTIIREIKNQTLKENDPILSERLLSEKFNISRISVRKGLKELIDEGYLYTVPGKGTFVRGLNSKVKASREKTHNLAYIFWGGDRSLFTIPYFAHMVAGAERMSQKNNYHLLISTFNPSEHLPNSLPSIIEQGKVDGALIEGTFIETYHQLSKILPVILISNFLYHNINDVEKIDDIDYVSANNEKACLRVMEYLNSLGHRNVGFVMGSPYHSSFRERLHGFYLGLKLYKMKTRSEWIISATETGSGAFKKILKCEQRPTAIISCNDFYALDILDYCNKEGIKIPDEFSIIGFDDIESSAWSQPALTTVRVLTDEMGEKAAIRLIEKINDPKSTPSTTLIGADLVIRESCKAIHDQ